jgi:hypothetical protein
LTALTASNARAGALQSTDQTTQVISGEGSLSDRQYIEHSQVGDSTFPGRLGGASWSFNWIAPASNVGPVTFYAAGNQADSNAINSDDQIYTARATTIPAGVPGAAPRITDAIAGKKHLSVFGEGFEPGALLFINGVDQKTRNDETNPTTILIGVKVVKKGRVPLGADIVLKVKNPSGGESEEFSFRRD